jgi:DNA-binding NtrC family response regulator
MLLVEPLRRLQRELAAATASHAAIDIVGSFADARRYVDAAPYDLVVANLRLGPYNGIHLAYVVAGLESSTRVIVHAGDGDAASARDIQRAGALYEHTERLIVALTAYLGVNLPTRDRRDPIRFDRRRHPRGGRRAWDRAMSR